MSVNVDMKTISFISDDKHQFVFTANDDGTLRVQVNNGMLLDGVFTTISPALDTTFRLGKTGIRLLGTFLTLTGNTMKVRVEDE